MNKRAPILGLAGLVFILFGLTEHWMTFGGNGVFSLGWFALLHIGAGTLCLLWYFVAGGGSLTDFARLRSTRYGASAVIYTLLFGLVMVMVNFMGVRYNQRFDISKAKVNSLSDQSIKVLNNLDGDVQIMAFVGPADKSFVDEIAGIYRYASPKVHFEIVDPQIHPEIAQKEMISKMPTLKIKIGERSTLVNKLDEESITNGINSVSRTKQKTIYFTGGHGEGSITEAQDQLGFSTFVGELKNQNYLVNSIFVAESTEIPEDAAAVVISATNKPWFPAELSAVDRYLERGGRVLFLLEPRKNPEFSDLLKKWGVRAGDDVVLDKQVRLFEGVSIGMEPVISNFTKHASVASMVGQRAMLSVARSVNVRQDAPKGILVEPVALSSDSSWAESEVDLVLDKGKAALQPESDEEGPVPIAIAGTAPLAILGNTDPNAAPDRSKSGEARYLVFGDSSFLTNRYVGQLFNDTLGLSAIGWLAGEDQLISIGPRAVTASRAYLTQSQARTVFYLSVLLLPELILLLGVAVWWRRSAL